MIKRIISNAYFNKIRIIRKERKWLSKSSAQNRNNTEDTVMINKFDSEQKLVNKFGDDCYNLKIEFDPEKRVDATIDTEQ